MNLQDTIVATATGNIISALGIIRLSGPDSIELTAKIFIPNNNLLFSDIAKANTLYYGQVVKFGTVMSKNDKIYTDATNIIDEVVVSVFKGPHSFTGEDTVEITHHGSPFISEQIIHNLLLAGAKLADRGEFSLRAFINGKINLSQAEAIADLIQSDNAASHDIAMKQLRGDYNRELKDLRQRFLKIASLLELEIDFSAEQEVFVDRNELEQELVKTKQKLTQLVKSFKQGNAFKNGIPVAIVGKPNSGKSTLMNAILKDERSIVSAREGTTRDTIEETISVNGLKIRFIDTAGIRESDDEIEQEGIKRSYDAIKKAQIVLYLLDSTVEDMESVKYQLDFFNQDIDLKDKRLILIVNKDDISSLSMHDREELVNMHALFVSAKQQYGIDNILNLITHDFDAENIAGNVFVSNIRHFNALGNALDEVTIALNAVMDGISSDLISENIRMAMQYIGEITGEISNEDVLSNIFSSFCIGK